MRITALTLGLVLASCGGVDDGQDDALRHLAECVGVSADELIETCGSDGYDLTLNYSCEQLRGALDGKADLGPDLAELYRKLRGLVDSKYRNHVCRQAQGYVQECMAGGGAWDLVECDAAQEKAARFVMAHKVCPWHKAPVADPVELREALVSLGFWMQGLPPAVEAADRKKAELEAQAEATGD